MNYKLKVALFLSLVSILTNVKITAGIPRTGSCEELKTGDEKWRTNHFHEALEIYMKVANNNNYNTSDRVGALQRLALQAYLKYAEADSALILLKQAVRLGEAKAISYSMMSRFALDKGLLDSAIILARHSLSESGTLSDSVQAVFSYGNSVFELAKKSYLTGIPIDTKTLKAVSRELAWIGQQVPSEVYIWDCLLGVSLLLGDGPVAMQAWKQYLRNGRQDDSLFNFIGESEHQLSDILSSWNNNYLDYPSFRLLAKALASSRMYDYAKMVVSS